ncbi:IS5 family transposase [Patescibacteria group bacterium]|nr:IS5 family transposase [Patescibacteria group bacterium]
MSAQASFLSIAYDKKLRSERFLDEMNRIIPWKALIRKIEPYYEEKQTGRKRKELKLMLKIYFLQQWYNLSDPEAEDNIYDRNSFQKFLDIDLLSDTVPDETTILNFRHLLEEHRLQEKMLKIVNDFLERNGLFMKHGTIVDATIIAAPSSTKNRDKKRDPEMHQTKKGNQWYFGMKGHIGVDVDSGIVHSVEGTAANVHDRQKLHDLLHGEEKAIFGDQGYASDEDKESCRKYGVTQWCVNDRGKRGRPLSHGQRKKNRKRSSVRAKVEHPFRVIKDQWGHRKVRYRGIKKNTLQLHMLFALANLYMKRRQLLA